jgi:hypothetical protein
VKLVRTVLGAAVAVATLAVLQAPAEAATSGTPVSTAWCFSCWEIVER